LVHDFRTSHRGLPALLLALIPAVGWGQEPNPPAFARPASELPADTAEAGPLYLFLNGPIDPESLRKRLGDPNFVILRGPEYERLRRAARDDAAVPAAPMSYVIDSVTVQGAVVADPAALTITYGLELRAGARSWIPLRLDGLVLQGVRDADRDCAVRTTPTGGWEVELRGAGDHRVAVQALVPLRPDGDDRTLGIAIPAAASTRIDLAFPPSIEQVQVGLDRPTALEPDQAVGVARLRQSVPPRDRLRLSWKPEDDRSAAGLPILSAQGEISVEVEAGTVRTHSAWLLRAERGAARSIRLRIPDPDTELVGVELGELPLAYEGMLDRGEGVLTIPLADPLLRGQVRRLALVTRHPVATDAPGLLKFGGFPIVEAASQTGVLAIVQGADVWVGASPGRGLRPIDPRRELPDALRARPSTVLAFQFVDQPFELEIRTDPAPPVVRVESRTSVQVHADTTRIATDLDYRVSQGAVGEVQVALADGMELESVGPETVVAASHTTVREEGPRVLTARLTPKATTDGVFRIQLAGRQRLARSSSVAVGLFQPIDCQFLRGTLVVLAGPEMAVEPPLNGPSSPFRPATPGAMSDASWPLAGASAVEKPQFWLSHDAPADAITLRVASRARSLTHATGILAEVSRRRVDLRQRSTIQIRNGTLARLEIAVPEAIEASWEIEGDEITSRERLGRDPSGASRYRLHLAREAVDQLELRFRAKLAIEPGIPEDSAATIRIPWIRILEGERNELRIEVAADASLDLQAQGTGWSAASVGGTADGPSEGPLPTRLRWAAGSTDDAEPALLVRATPVAAVPGVLISRFLIRTAESQDGSLSALCWLRVDRHPGAVDLRLGPGYQIIQARLGAESIRPLQLDGPRELRLLIPREATVPLTLRIDLRRGAGGTSADAIPLGLLGDAVVAETLCEISLPWSRALVGTPVGWSDANRWYWGRYVWKRRPRLRGEDLSRWVGLTAAAESIPSPSREAHQYLFSRIGEPGGLHPSTYSRAGLVALCSGTTLVLGLVLLLARPPARLLWLTGLATALALGIAVEPDTLLLGIQSAALGVALSVVAALTQRFVDRRRGRHTAGGRSALGGPGPMVVAGSSRDLDVEGPMEGSTVIRRRASTTIDYAPAGEPAPGEGAV
jgi:hypothetical protein